MIHFLNSVRRDHGSKHLKINYDRGIWFFDIGKTQEKVTFNSLKVENVIICNSFVLHFIV